MLVAVGGALRVTSTRTTLFLSRKVTRAPVPCCAHPSGYFIEYAACASRKRMNTWLSGMSPVAAAFASAWSALAEGVVVPVAAVLVAAEMVGGADIAGVTVFLPPQPVSAKAALSVLAIKGRG